MVSKFRDAIIFFDQLGVYDVILPFLLVFSVVYAILDKTRVLGTDTLEDGTVIGKRNINAMIAFVVAFFVVASTRLVRAINEALANTVLLLLLVVMFLMLIGAFFKNGEDVYLKEGGWRTLFMVIIFIAIIMIFLHAIPTSDGGNWLNYAWVWLTIHWDTTAVASIILFIVLLLVMWGITKEPSTKKTRKEE